MEDVALTGPDGRVAREVAIGSPLTVSLALCPRDGAVARVIVGVAIHRVADGVVCYDASTEADGVDVGRVDGRLEVSLGFDRLDLLPGEYAIDVGVYADEWRVAYDYHWQAYGLTVTGPAGDRGVFRPPHSWAVAR